MSVPDDNKRTEVICVKVTERMALDILRDASADDRSISDFIFRLLRQHLYGSVARLECDRHGYKVNVGDPRV